MRFLSTVAVLLCALTSVLASSDLHANHIHHESLPYMPHGWHVLKAAHPDTYVTYRIAVRQNVAGVKEVEKYLLSHSSNPSSHLFGHHLTSERVTEMTRPHHESVDTVVEWLSQAGVTDLKHTAGGTFISFRATVELGNRLLNTEYKVFEHKATGHRTVRTDSYSLPALMKPHIDFVSPATRFPAQPKRLASPEFHTVDRHGKYHPLSHMQTESVPNAGIADGFGTHPHVKDLPAGVAQPAAGPPVLPPIGSGPIGLQNGTACYQLVTPQCFREQYETSTYNPQVPDKNSLAVTGYIGQYYDIQNLNFSLATFTAPFYNNPPVTDYPPPVVKGDGGNPQGENNAGYVSVHLNKITFRVIANTLLCCHALCKMSALRPTWTFSRQPRAPIRHRSHFTLQHTSQTTLVWAMSQVCTYTLFIRN